MYCFEIGNQTTDTTPYRQTDRTTDGQADNPTDKPTNQPTFKQTDDRLTDRHIYKTQLILGRRCMMFQHTFKALL